MHEAVPPYPEESEVRRIFGKTAPEVLEVEKKAHKNDPAGHALRLSRILDNWDEIVRAMDEELPSYEKLRAQMENLGAPVKPSDLGISMQDTLDAFMGSRDIRNKYLTSTLLWDLGEIEDFREILRAEAEE